ncbi:MAG: nitronate monooxygenase [Acidobacteria bacterium]|nr:nitronate monooxygenase [Acidobacteriota bacterium]
MKKNRVCELLGIEYPILQGGMFRLADAGLVAAVSKAGALGTLSPHAGMPDKGNPADNLRIQIQKIRKLTDRPFAVNVLLDLPESGLTADALLQEKVHIVVTAAGSPDIYTDLFHSAGMLVLHVTGSVSQARGAESCGVDAVIAEGCEAAGRIAHDEIPLLSLLPQVADVVKIPVIAAGGIADGRGMAAAFALGAEGIQLGTRFVAVEECIAHPAYKKAIVESGDSATVVTRRGTIPTRSLKSRFIEELAAMEESGIEPDRIREFIGRNRTRAAQIEGDIENGDAYAGLSAGMIREILPAGIVVRKIMKEYQDTVRCNGFLPLLG